MKKISKYLAFLIAVIMIFSISPVKSLAASRISGTSISSVARTKDTVKVTWKKNGKITGYYVQIATNSKFKKAKTYKVTKSSTTSLKISKLTPNKRYYVRVRTYKGKSKSSWSKSKSVTTRFANLTGLKVETGFSDDKAKVSWNKVSNASGYQIKYSEYKNYKDAKTITIKGNETTTKKLTKLHEYGDCYIKVRAYKTVKGKKIYTNWTKANRGKYVIPHDHSGLTGNMGKWFNSRAEVNDYYNSVVDYWVDKEKNGEIAFEEMLKNCPSGYECWSCAECGKWTGNFYD